MNYLYLAVVLAPLVVLRQPEGSVQWSPGYPITVPATGVALIKATVKPAKGFRLSHAEVQYWQGGSVLHTKAATLDAEGGIVAYVSDLERGKSYYVVIDVAQIRDNEEQVLRTDPRIIGR